MGEYPGFLVNWVGARARSAFAAALDAFDLRPQQFAALVVIADSPGMAQQELVDATGIDPSTMVAMLDSLEEAGLAERRQHPTDRRKRALYLTPEGEQRLRAGQAAARSVGDTVFAPLTRAESAELHRLLRKIAGYPA